MTAYKTIKGFTVQSLATDPKATGIAGATWSSGGNLNTARRNLGGTGTQTAALAFGGNNGSALGVTETYDGSSWSEVADLNTVRFGLGSANAAPQTAALGFGGEIVSGPTYQVHTEKWDGSSWTEVNNLPTAISHMAGAGTQTAALSIAGEPTYDASVEFDGTNWTAGGSLNAAKYQLAGCGLQTAAIAFGGRDPLLAQTEIYNG